jgi:hypothetical protein
MSHEITSFDEKLGGDVAHESVLLMKTCEEGSKTLLLLHEVLIWVYKVLYRENLALTCFTNKITT